MKLTTPKTPASEEPSKKAGAKKQGTSAKKGSKATASNGDEAAEAKEPEKPVDPQEAKAKREKEGASLCPNLRGKKRKEKKKEKS